MNKYRIYNKLIGYEELVEAESEQETEIQGLEEVGSNIQEYIDINVKQINKEE